MTCQPPGDSRNQAQPYRFENVDSGISGAERDLRIRWRFEGTYGSGLLRRVGIVHAIPVICVGRTHGGSETAEECETGVTRGEWQVSLCLVASTTPRQGLERTRPGGA